MLIGLPETINTLHFYMLMKTLPKFPGIAGFSAEGYFAFSWACASAARSLGRPDLFVKTVPGELYLAGLLHGVGKVVLALHWRKDFERSLELARERLIPLHQAEEEVLGFNHAALGAGLLEAWNLPPSIRAAVSSYVAPETAASQYTEIAALTQLAYFIANQSGIGMSGSAIENDTSKSWIVKEGSSPLAEEATREKVIEEIMSTLRKKSGVIGRSGSNEKENNAVRIVEESSPPAKAVREEAAESAFRQPPKKHSWKGLTKGLRSAFAK
jgi:hypothetical protein